MAVEQGGAPEGVQESVQTEQQRVEAEAVARFKQSQPGFVDENPIPEGHNPDGTPIAEGDNIPDKYKGKSVEDVIKMHQEAEKLLSKSNEPVQETPPKEVETPKAEEQPKTEATGFEKFVTEYSTEGAISEASYKELADKGFSKADIDGYIEGQKAIGASFTKSIHDITGGEEGYNDLINWAVEGMDADSITEYNTAIQSGDQARVKRLVEYMSLKRGQTQQQPNRIDGSGESEGGGLKAFNDKSEWMIATNNRLYGKDKKYTAMVDGRYLKSKRKGTL